MKFGKIEGKNYLLTINNITIPIQQQQIVKKFAVVAAVNFRKLKEKRKQKNNEVTFLVNVFFIKQNIGRES